MDSFLRKYDFLHLSDLFTSNGVKDEEFIALDDVQVLDILGKQQHVTVLNFISKFNFEKGLTVKSSSQSKDTPVEPMEVTELENSENLTPDQTGPSVIPPPIIDRDIIITEDMDEMETDTFIYKENELFHLLNSSLEGRIVLGKYRQVSRELDYSKLKDIIIFNKLNEDAARNYKITPQEFKHLQDQIVELFPTEDPELFFVPYYRNEAGQCVSAKGLLYDHYKHIRKDLRLAGILTALQERNGTSECDTNFEGAICLTLCDPNRTPYSPAEVIREWGNSYTERAELLLAGNKKKENTLKKYFKSFPYLTSPLGISLLESDFERIFEELSKERTPDANNLVPQYATLFSTTWPQLSKRIIAHLKKSKIKDVVEFFKLHDKLINEGTHSSVLALLLLPICVTVSKSLKVPESNAGNISKEIISKCFILHVQEYENIEREKEEFENFLKKYQQPIPPYVIICGKIERIYQTYVILNNEKYEFEDPVKAVEASFKCLTALRKWRYLCDYVWVFIRKFVFEIDSDKNYTAITKLIVRLKKG